MSHHRQHVGNEHETTDSVNSPTLTWIQQAAIRSALRAGNGALAVRIAMLSGARDENALTDLLFYVRFPEQQGRRIVQGDPLAKSWREIRERLVRPALAQGKRHQSPGRSSDRRMQRIVELVPLLNQYRDEIPLDLLLGWIDVESGGQLANRTDRDERGYFQIDPRESQKQRIDHARLSTDRAYSVRAGIVVIRDYMRQAQRLGFRPGTDVFWHVVKFFHSLGSGGVGRLIQAMRKHGVAPTTWDSIRQYAIDHRHELRQLLRHDPVKWTTNVDHVFRQGRLLVASLPV